MADAVGEAPSSTGAAGPMEIYFGAMGGFGLSLDELFALVGASSATGPCSARRRSSSASRSRSARATTVRGGITGVVRKEGRRAGIFDIVTFRLELVDGDGEVAASRRTRSSSPGGTGVPLAARGRARAARDRVGLDRGDEDGRGAAPRPEPDPLRRRRRARARDGRPAREPGAEQHGLRRLDALALPAGGRERNRRLRVRFLGNVLAGDRLVARGRRRRRSGEQDGERVAEVDVWLERGGGDRVLEGTRPVLVD